MTKKDIRKNNQQASMQALQELISTAERSIHHAKNLMAQIMGKKPTEAPDTLSVGGLHEYKHGKAKVIE